MKNFKEIPSTELRAIEGGIWWYIIGGAALFLVGTCNGYSEADHQHECPEVCPEENPEGC